MHVLVALVDLLGVRFGCEPGQALLVDVDLHWLVAGDEDVDSQIELVTVNQQWVGDVLADDTGLVDIHVVDVINKVNTSALAGVRRLHDPDIFLAFVLLQLLIVVVEVAKLVRKDVGVRGEVEGALAKPLLHAHDVEAESILAGDLIRLREVVDFLVLVKTLVLV